MKSFISISGSLRSGSASTALLEALAKAAPPGVTVHRFGGVGQLPIFSPDLEGPPAPPVVEDFAKAVAEADALIVAVPEYVRTLPGGFKNALDWLVSRPELIGKTIAIAHASHRGDEMLGHLRRVLETVSTGFRPDIFLREEIVHRSPEERAAFLAEPQTQARLRDFLQTLAKAPAVQA